MAVQRACLSRRGNRRRERRSAAGGTVRRSDRSTTGEGPRRPAVRGSITGRRRPAQRPQRTPAEAQDVLARLADGERGLLEPTRRTLRKPFPAYRLRNEPLAALARAVTYRRRTIDQIDEKVIEHIQEYGFVTNRTIQRLFDRELYAARNLLNDLRDRGILEKVGSARGGPGVKYGPGPKFPKVRRPTDTRGAPNAGSVPDQLSLPDDE